VRADKTCLAGLTATLLHYLKDEAERKVPIVRMMSLTQNHLRVRVDNWVEEIGAGKIVKGESTVGGGSLPGESIPTQLLSLEVESAERFLRLLRRNFPPIIARTENDRVLLDPRTVLQEQDQALIAGVKKVLESLP
jgi:L-seryl-tRNA(Ser) seleniumtransferase